MLRVKVVTGIQFKSKMKPNEFIGGFQPKSGQKVKTAKEQLMQTMYLNVNVSLKCDIT